MTDFYCTAEEFRSVEYHIDRLWRQDLHFFKIKAFRLMYHYVRAQSALQEGNFPAGWHEFGAGLPLSHVLHRETYRNIMHRRMQSIEVLQVLHYNQLTVAEIEQFDQASTEQYLQTAFSVEEFIYAAGLVGMPPRD